MPVIIRSRPPSPSNAEEGEMFSFRIDVSKVQSAFDRIVFFLGNPTWDGRDVRREYQEMIPVSPDASCVKISFLRIFLDTCTLFGVGILNGDDIIYRQSGSMTILSYDGIGPEMIQS